MGHGRAGGRANGRLTGENEMGGKVDIDITFPFHHNAKYSCPCLSASLLIMNIIVI